MTETIKRDLGTETAEPQQVVVPQQRRALHDRDGVRQPARSVPVTQGPGRSLTFSWVFLAALALAVIVVVAVSAAAGSNADKPQSPQPAPSSSDLTQLLTGPLSSAPPTPQRPGADWLT